MSVGQLRGVLLGGHGGGAALNAGTSVPGHLADQSLDTLGTDARSTATVRVRRNRGIPGDSSLARHRSVISMLDRYGGAEEGRTAVAM